MLQNTPTCHFGPFSVQNSKNFWTKKDIKNRQQRIGKKTTERKWATFQDQGTNRLKIKRKRKLWKWTQRNGQFYVQLVYRKPMQPCNFDGIFYQLRHWIFSHGFHRTIRVKRKFKKRRKSDFRQKSSFLPYIDALTLSRAGFFGAPAWGHKVPPPPSKNPVPLLRNYSSKFFLKASPKLSLVKKTWFPWKPWLWF